MLCGVSDKHLLVTPAPNRRKRIGHANVQGLDNACGIRGNETSRCSIWVWKYFEARANTCHGGNLEEALGFFFNFSFAEFIQSGAVKAAIPVNEN